MAITPNTAFSAGAILTASQMNRFPRGVMGVQTLTTSQNTAATHTNLQDTGATLTFTEESGRIYRITYSTSPYPNGGLQAIVYQLQRAGSNIKEFVAQDVMLTTVAASPFAFIAYYTATTSGSATYKFQFRAAVNNTVVQDYGAAANPRMFMIEDIGAS